jgi:hypothetical protein
MHQRNAQTVARVKGFLLIVILSQPKASISQHAIAIHQQKLDATCPRDNFL